MWRYIRENRHIPTDMLIRKLNEVLIGYDHYYGITDNYASLQKFHARGGKEPVQMAEPQEPARKLYMGRLQRFHENEAIGGT